MDEDCLVSKGVYVKETVFLLQFLKKKGKELERNMGKPEMYISDTVLFCMRMCNVYDTVRSPHPHCNKLMFSKTPIYSAMLTANNKYVDKE